MQALSLMMESILIYPPFRWQRLRAEFQTLNGDDMEENESEEETEDGNQLKKMMKSKALFCLYQRILSQENNTV